DLHPTRVTRSFTATVERVVAGEPGQTVTHTLIVTNTGDITGSYKIWAKTTTYREFILPGLTYGSDTFDYWRHVGTIGAGESIQMPINVRIPSYATNNQFEQTSLFVYDDDGYAPTVSMQLVTAVSYTTAIERVGHIGLDARDVVIKDDYAYVAAGIEGLLILDVSDVLNPVKAGVYKTGAGALGQVESVQVVGNYAYLVTNLSGLRIVDVSNPVAPVEVGAYTPGGSIKKVELAGNYAYIVWASCRYGCADKLRIVDISNPASPFEVSVYGKSFTGAYYAGDQFYDVAVTGHYVCLFAPDEMRVLDVSNPAHPLETKTYPMTGSSVIVQGDYAYLRSSDEQVRVIDISNPNLVVSVGVYNVPHKITNLSTAGNYLYVTTENDDVYILDLAVPSSPAQAGIYHAPGNRQTGGTAAKEKYLYLAAGSAGLQIIDLSNPAAPEKAGVYGAPSAVMGVALDKNYLYVADRYNGLRILERAAGGALAEVGAYAQPALDVALDGEGFAYLISRNCEYDRYRYNPCYGDLLILDVSNPAAPVQIGLYEGDWRKVEVADGRVFVVGKPSPDDGKTVHILDISNRTAPRKIAAYDAGDFTLADGYLYLIFDGYGEEERLTILNASTLKEVSVYQMEEHNRELTFFREIAVSGDYAYILENVFYATGRFADWLILDISDPTMPVKTDMAFHYRGVIESGSHPAAVTHDGHTFLAAKGAGLRVLNVTDVPTPTEVDSFGAPNRVTDIAISPTGDIYLASDANGLYVLQYARKHL
ncbi:hypothetical protein D6833_13175, partial [Candidatus Parcubacteria bacterium]